MSQQKAYFNDRHGNRIELLTKDNWLQWSESIRHLLEGKLSWGYITGDEVRPESLPDASSTGDKLLRSTQQLEWDQQKAAAGSYIWQAISPQCRKVCRNLSVTNPRDLWNKLKETYDPTTNDQGRSELFQKFWSTVRAEKESVTDFFDKLIDIRDSIGPTIEAPTISDNMIRNHIYESIGETYEPTTRALRADETKALDAVIKAYEKDEQSLNLKQKKQQRTLSNPSMSHSAANQSSTPHSQSANAYYTGNNNNMGRQSGHRNYSGRVASMANQNSHRRSYTSGVGCWYHMSDNHSEQNCYTLQRLRSQGFTLQPPVNPALSFPSQANAHFQPTGSNAKRSFQNFSKCDICFESHETRNCPGLSAARQGFKKQRITSRHDTNNAHANITLNERDDNTRTNHAASNNETFQHLEGHPNDFQTPPY
ncbi:MAG: hypothetical protein H7X86_14180 [Gorillibacterium sp.]|nr:hypothetical protein [Gorillibacterium sp.]